MHVVDMWCCERSAGGSEANPLPPENGGDGAVIPALSIHFVHGDLSVAFSLMPFGEDLHGVQVAGYGCDDHALAIHLLDSSDSSQFGLVVYGLRYLINILL